MRGCEWCDYKETEWLLYQSLYWSVYLADRQDYIGRCILVLNRHCGSLSELDISEIVYPINRKLSIRFGCMSDVSDPFIQIIHL